MAAPTAIPHAQHSSHHQHHASNTGESTAVGETSGSLSRSPTGTSPRSLVSPIYTQAGRSSFSLPGPNSSSTSPTTTTWYSAGFASGNSQRVRSPTAPFATTQSSSSAGGATNADTPAIVQHDSFFDAAAAHNRPSHHFRAASFGSASNASSLSSADLRDEPTTPSLSRAPGTMPLSTSFEQMKNRRDSWSLATGSGNRWSGLAGLRERAAATTIPSESVVLPNESSVTQTNNSGPMGGLLRRISIGAQQAPLKSPPSYNNQAKVNASTAQPSAATLSPISPSLGQDDVGSTVQPQMRGRRGSQTGSQRRRPSPMGERLLMGHFNAH